MDRYNNPLVIFMDFRVCISKTTNISLFFFYNKMVIEYAQENFFQYSIKY